MGISRRNERVLLAMSGGVDSSVAAHLLTREGYDVVGVFMRHGVSTTLQCDTALPPGTLPVVSQKAHKQGCCSASDAEDARRIADVLDMPFYALDLSQQFDQIIDYFVDEYTHGRTPNPCVMCNNQLKFGKLFDYADSVGADYVATGHYARLVDGQDQSRALLRGVDQDKDQSYVLFGVRPSLLRRMMLPVGHYRKQEIRSLAAEFGLPVAEKPDSQEICFVAAGRHAEFVSRRRNRDTRGELVTTDGQVVGHHDGIERFTIGQRKGLGVALGEPYFVVRIEAEENRVVVGKRDELAQGELVADRVNWLSPVASDAFDCEVQIRYNSRASAATAFPQSDGSLRIRFREAKHGVAPGQAAVCYEGDRVICGGWISR